MISRNRLSIAAVILLSACSQGQSSRPSSIAGVKSFAAFSQETRSASATPDCGSDCTQRRNEFAYVAYVGKQIYCYWDLKKADTKTDFDTLAASLESQITDKTSYTQYYLLLRQWASAFHDGHVNVMATADMTGLEVYTSPVRVEVLAPATDHEKIIIVAVDAGTDGVKVGDEIMSVNGVNAHDALSAVVATSASGSTERMRRFFGAKRLVDVIGIENGSAPLTLSLASPDGTAKTVSLRRNIEIDAKPQVNPLAAASATEATGATNISATILPGGIGYLRIDGFGGAQDEFLFDQMMDRLADTQGLILDLRKNGGGDLSGDRILARLAKANITRYKRSARISDYLMASRPDIFSIPHAVDAPFTDWLDLVVTANTAKTYSKPVVAMISPNCFSACDTFSAALKGNHLAKFLGEATGGGTGTPLVFDLPVSPLQFRYGVIRGQTPAGDLIEGIGTSPDVYMEPTLADRINHTDSQLVKAVEMITAQSATSSDSETISSSVKMIWEQRMDVSPTSEENNLLLQFSHTDEL